MNNLKILYAKLSVIRTIPIFIAFTLNKDKKIIIEDINRWVKIEQLDNLKYSKIMYLNYFIVNYKEFRNIFYYRIGKTNKILSVLLEILYKPRQDLFICCDEIGGGLFIQHGFSTIIACKSIGCNAWINQQVTIGYSLDNKSPSIGNRVRISAGAKVIGGVIVNDNVTIGANAVVTKDIPENAVAVGVPAKVIKYK